MSNHINHKVFSICFEFIFQLFLQLLCISLILLIFRYSTRIVLENALFCRQAKTTDSAQNSAGRIYASLWLCFTLPSDILADVLGNSDVRRSRSWLVIGGI